MRKYRIAVAVILGVVLGGLAVLLCTRGMSGESEPETHVLRVVLWDYDTVNYDRRIIEAFEAQNPDITVEVTSYSPTSYDFSLRALLASDEQVDIIYANQLPQFAWLCQEGYLLPLDTFIQRDGMDLSCYSNMDVLRMPETGEVMGLPYRQDKFLLYYNMDLFDQAGLEYPSDKPTWEEVCALAQQLSAGQQGTYGIYLSALPEHLIPQSLDVSFDYTAGDLETLAEGLERYTMLAECGAAPQFSDLDRTDPAQRLFETGEYGMFLNGSWYLNFLAEDTEAERCSFRWGVVERSAVADGAAQNPMMLTPVCIYRDTTEPEAAWRFLRFVCGEDGANILAEQMVLPAYHSPQTDAQVASRAQHFGIDADLLLDGFDAPEALPAAQERKIRQAVYDIYEQVLLGLEEIDGFLPQAEQARADCLNN